MFFTFLLCFQTPVVFYGASFYLKQFTLEVDYEFVIFFLCSYKRRKDQGSSRPDSEE